MCEVIFATVSEKGRRETNEDAYLAIQVGDRYIFAVADGLGGCRAGEVASSHAISVLERAVRTSTEPARVLLENAVSDAHREIISNGNLNPAQFGMATTLVAAVVEPDCRCTIINVGDSRAYRIDGLVRHTRDHSYVQSLLDTGEITPAEAWRHPFGNIITQAIGDRDLPIVPDIYESEAKGTYLVLSSDGMHDYVPEDRIAEIIRSCGEDLMRSCNQLIAEALVGGSEDNITVIVARIGEADTGKFSPM